MGKAGRPGIGLHDVARACVSLHRQRRTFGPTNIRLELGTGSYSTIVRHLDRLALVDANATRATPRGAQKNRLMKR
jgi:hypothetical protein